MALYHEKQVAGLCGVHAINTLLQGPFISEWDLAKIAQDLDALERQLMASQGMDTEAFRRFAAEESGNVAGNGMFSIQVGLPVSHGHKNLTSQRGHCKGHSESRKPVSVEVLCFASRN
jgi:hypothetical protein